MHISCIRTLSFFLLVLYCDCIFCFFPSLSLSLSLSLGWLCMAPKCKSTLSQNSLCSETSSFDPTPLHIQFCDEKAHKDFSKNFYKRGVHSKRHVVLSDFFDFALTDAIHTRGWKSLCEIPVSCPIVIIQEFYSNMHGINTSIPQFAMYIWGTHIIVTPELISEILHILRVSHLDYPLVHVWGLCPRTYFFYLSFVRHLPHEVSTKTPHDWALQMV